MAHMGEVTSPLFSETAKKLVGQMVAVQTTANTVQQGILSYVLQDHIVLEVSHVPFFIRTREIVWITLGRQH